MKNNTNHQAPLLTADKISKKFPGVKALDGICFHLDRGEILGLLGENGAGKSTLAKVLVGVNRPDTGTICINGKEITIDSPKSALEHGIAIIHQDIFVFPNLSVAENLFIEDLPRNKASGKVDWKLLYEQSKEILASINLNDLNPRMLCEKLGPAERQLVEIGRALRKNPRILIMDEPTTALSGPEISRLFEIVSNLKSKGYSVIFISHHIKDVLKITDRILVLRDGMKVGEYYTKEMTLEKVVDAMVGRKIKEMYPKTKAKIGGVGIEIRGLTSKKLGIKDISFVGNKSEIVGFTGLMGSGKTSVAESIFGSQIADAGILILGGREYDLTKGNPSRSLERKIGYVPEDRKERGLILPLPVGENISITILSELEKLFLFLQKKNEKRMVNNSIKNLSITPPNPRRLVRYLSGGNQQKVVLAKWFGTDPDILILDEPTKGVDVGAKSEIFRLVSEFVVNGGTALIFSSEITELLAVCDRIYVLFRGKIVGCLNRDKANEKLIGQYATGAYSK